MIYLIADTHFGDDAVRLYENRPFANVQEMDEALIQKWNGAVGEEDLVYLLGDFSVPGREQEFLNRLQGKKILVKGNHDLLSNEEYRRMGFAEVYDLPVILDGFWILSHEPLYVNENMPYANLFGHVHASPLYRTFSSHHYCVSAERLGFVPITFQEVRRAVQEAAERKKTVPS